MPKMKSRRGAVKRFRKTGSGRIRRGSPNSSHNFANKTRKQKRRLRRTTMVAPSDERRILTQINPSK